MAEHRVCPWWLGYLLASPVRRLWHDPAAILAPHVHSGMTVVEPGPGMGYFTPELARLVGPSGRVVAVEIEPKMLERLRRRLAKAGLAGRVECRLAEPHSMGVADLWASADFLLAFAVVHELPSAGVFFEEAAACLKPGGRLLLAEPSGHVPEPQFAIELQQAERAGLRVKERPAVRGSRAALLERH